MSASQKYRIYINIRACHEYFPFYFVAFLLKAQRPVGHCFRLFMISEMLYTSVLITLSKLHIKFTIFPSYIKSTIQASQNSSISNVRIEWV